MMQYAWEKKAKKHVADMLTEYFSAFGEDGRFQIVGVSVVNHEAGEAALIQIDKFPKDIIGADYAQDILGDAQRHYDKAAKHI